MADAGDLKSPGPERGHEGSTPSPGTQIPILDSGFPDHGVRVIIRAATRKDAGALVRLIRGLHSHPEHRAPRVWLLGTPAQVLQTLMTDRAVHLLVAEANGGLQGYVAGRHEIRPRGRPRHVGYIMEAFVKPGIRRRGVGVALVDRLLEWFEKKRVEDVSVSFVVKNRIARSFWNRLGFRPLILKATATPGTIRRRTARFRFRSASPR